MRDSQLDLLVDQAGDPFPPGLAAEEIEGVDLALLDYLIMGVASHYADSSRALSDEHRELLQGSLVDLDRIFDALPRPRARDYFARTRAVAAYILEQRASG